MSTDAADSGLRNDRRLPLGGLKKHGPASLTQPGRLFPEYPPMTVKEYADLRGVNIELLLRSFNASAESERFVRRNPWILSERNEPEVIPGVCKVRARQESAF